MKPKQRVSHAPSARFAYWRERIFAAKQARYAKLPGPIGYPTRQEVRP